MWFLRPVENHCSRLSILYTSSHLLVAIRQFAKVLLLNFWRSCQSVRALRHCCIGFDVSVSFGSFIRACGGEDADAALVSLPQTEGCDSVLRLLWLLFETDLCVCYKRISFFACIRDWLCAGNKPMLPVIDTWLPLTRSSVFLFHTEVVLFHKAGKLWRYGKFYHLRRTDLLFA